ncbi:MAG: chromosome partitioning protein ParA, partial [Bacteroidia bacterium]|nr:chromosome partitioning protein ParA [Bacteroidia bacterium]
MVDLDQSLPSYLRNFNVTNELLQFKSRKLLENAVRRTNANVSYTVPIRFRRIELYNNAPCTVNFLDSVASPATFTLRCKDDKQVFLSNFQGSDDGKVYTASFHDIVQTPIGNIVVQPNTNFNPSWYGVDILVSKQHINSSVGFYQGNISIDPQRQSTVMVVSARDYSSRRASDLLHALVEAYNEEAINDKNQISINTAAFIDERIQIIG